MDQHPSGRADLYDYISANNICNNVDNTNVSNDIIENNDVIASIEPHLKFWPNNEDPWGEQTEPPSLVRSNSQPNLSSSHKSLRTQSANTSAFPSGTTLDTTETEYTLDPTDQQGQLHTHVLRPGSSVASLSTGTDTPVQTDSDKLFLSAGEIAEAQKLFKTALSNYANEVEASKSCSRENLRQDVPLDNEEEELLQELITVPPVNSCQNAEIQVDQRSAPVTGDEKENLVTEIDMPLDFQRFLKHFFMAKVNSDNPVYEKDWSVSDVGTIDNLDSLRICPPSSHTKKNVNSLSQESDVFAKIRSELGEIAFRAKESVTIEASKQQCNVAQLEKQPEVSDDFRSKICKRLQSLTLADSAPTPENPLDPKIQQEQNKDTVVVANEQPSSTVKVIVSPSYFAMKGPWLGHLLSFHMEGNTEIPSFSTADKFEFNSRTPIADAIKLVSACSNQTELDSFLQSTGSKRKKPRRHASVQVDLGSRTPTPVPTRRKVPIVNSAKNPISKSKLNIPNKTASAASQNWRNREETEVIPKDVWKHYRRTPRSLVTDTTPDGASVSSVESPCTDNYNPVLSSYNIGQYDGAFDLLEDDLQSESSLEEQYHSVSDSDASSLVSGTSSLNSKLEEDNDLMDSFSMILQESDTSEKSDKELVADRAEWDLQGISQTGGSGNRKNPGGM